MRVNIYDEELPDNPETKMLTKKVGGKVFYGVRLVLAASVLDEDDSPAVTFWTGPVSGEYGDRYDFTRLGDVIDGLYQRLVEARERALGPDMEPWQDG